MSDNEGKPCNRRIFIRDEVLLVLFDRPRSTRMMRIASERHLLAKSGG